MLASSKAYPILEKQLNVEKLIQQIMQQQQYDSNNNQQQCQALINACKIYQTNCNQFRNANDIQLLPNTNTPPNINTSKKQKKRKIKNIDMPTSPINIQQSSSSAVHQQTNNNLMSAGTPTNIYQNRIQNQMQNNVKLVPARIALMHNNNNQSNQPSPYNNVQQPRLSPVPHMQRLSPIPHAHTGIGAQYQRNFFTGQLYHQQQQQQQQLQQQQQKYLQQQQQSNNNNNTGGSEKFENIVRSRMPLSMITLMENGTIMNKFPSIHTSVADFEEQLSKMKSKSKHVCISRDWIYLEFHSISKTDASTPVFKGKHKMLPLTNVNKVVSSFAVVSSNKVRTASTPIFSKRNRTKALYVYALDKNEKEIVIKLECLAVNDCRRWTRAFNTLLNIVKSQ